MHRKRDLLCGIRSNGGITKAFNTLEELCLHVNSVYGDEWRRYVRVRIEGIKDQVLAQLHAPRRIDVFAPDLQGKLDELGRVTYNGSTFIIFNTPSDGSCMYHSIAAMLHGTVDDTTAGGLNKMLLIFYQTKGQIKQVLERRGINFENKLEDLRSPGHWGEFTDTVAIATLFKVKFLVFLADSMENLRILNIQEVIGLRSNGYRLSRPKQVDRILVFFTTNSHYGVGVRRN